MKPSTFLILFPSLLLAAAIEAPVEGYDVFEPQWEVEVSPGGPVVVLNGTAEEVHEELLAMNPNWDSDFPIDLPEDTDGRSTLERRTDFSGAKVECWDQRVDSSEIRTGERYLRGLTGRPTNKAGPGTCGRVSCSWNSAIWWCNDERQSKTLESYGSIADGARKLINACSFGVGRAYVAGQVFHKTNWNVIVRKDSC